MELGPGWEAEIMRRVAEVKGGAVNPVPLGDVLDGAFRATLLRRRQEMRSGKEKGITLEQLLSLMEQRAAKRAAKRR